MADRAALLVGDIFRGPRVALPVHLRDYTTELGLLRSEQHDALNVAVDKVVIIRYCRPFSFCCVGRNTYSAASCNSYRSDGFSAGLSIETSQLSSR